MEYKSSRGSFSFAIICSIVGGMCAVVVEMIDYFVWGTSWVDATSFLDYTQKIWYIPIGFAFLCGIIGFLRGEKVHDFIQKCWQFFS